MSKIKSIAANLQLAKKDFVELSDIATSIYYYDSFTTALADANSNSTANYSPDFGTQPEACIMRNDDVQILRLMSAVYPNESISISADMILDLNGQMLDFSSGAHQLVIEQNASVIIYGMKANSSITQVFSPSSNVTFSKGQSLIKVIGNYIGVFGGTYSMTANVGSVLGTVFAVQNGDSVFEKCTIYHTDFDAGTNNQNLIYGIYSTNNDGYTIVKNCIIDVNHMMEGSTYGIILNNKLNSVVGTTINVTSFDPSDNTVRGYASCFGIYNSSYDNKSLIKDCIIKSECGCYKNDVVDSDGNVVTKAGTIYDGGIGISNSGEMWLSNNDVLHIGNSSVTNRNIMYILSGEYKNPSHGLYNSKDENAIPATLYVIGGKFIHTAKEYPDISTEFASSACYLGYGSTAYIDGAEFLSERGNCSIAFNQRIDGGGGNPIPSTAYVSNTICHNTIRGASHWLNKTPSRIFVGENCDFKMGYYLEEEYEGSLTITETGENYKSDIPPVTQKPFNDILMDINASVLNLKQALLAKGVEVDDLNGLEDIGYTAKEYIDTENQFEDGYNSGYSTGYSNGKGEGFSEGYTSGREDGIEDGIEYGKLEEYNTFWDTIQNYGNGANYEYRFFQYPVSLFNPKYDFVLPAGNVYAANSIFCKSALTDIKKNIDATLLQGTYGLQYTFYECKSLVNARTIIVTENTAYTAPFGLCNSLQEVRFQGTIGKNGLSFQWCPLSRESLASIVDALADKSTDTSGTEWKITFGEINMGNLTEDETLTIENKGWTYA